MNIRQLIKNFSYTISSNAITLVISSILVLIVPKFIGVTEYSYWQLYIFYITYAGVLSLGWADGIYLRYGGKDYSSLDKRLFYSQFLMYSFIQIVISGLIFLASFIFVNNAQKQFIFYMVAICCFLFNIRGFILYILQDTNRIKEYAIVNSVGQILYLVCIIFALFIDDVGYKMFILADLFGRIISLIIGIYFIKDIVMQRISNFYLSLQEMWENISVGIKLLLANFAGTLVIGVVRYGIQYFWSIRTFGKVSLTLSISNFIMAFISAISLVLYPALKSINESKAKDIYENIRELLLLILFIVLIAYYPINYLLPMWLPKYKDSLVYLAILFPMCVYQGKFDLLINTFMKTFRLEKSLLWVNIITVLCSAILTILNGVFIHSLDMIMLSILAILWIQSTLGELVLARNMGKHIFGKILLETAVIASFVLTSWYLGNLLGFGLYVGCILLYFFASRKILLKSVMFLKGR